MASLYKKPVIVTDPKTGKKIKTKSKKWWGRYRDEFGAEKRVPLATDKTAAQAMLNDLVKKAEQRACGVIDRFDEHRKRPIAEHVADFENHMKTKGNSPEQVKLVAMRCRRIVAACKATHIGDISASRVQAYLADLREKENKSTQTSNHYLRAIKQFTRWLVKDRRASDDALAHMAMLNVSTDRRHDRRPFSEAEMTAILQAASAGPIVRRMDGPNRAMLYAVAGYTGLRASELASLTPDSFDLDGDHATVTVEAAYSKHRRQDVMPLHDSLVALLRPWLAAKPEGQSVWPGNWAKGKEAGAMLKADLLRARTAWIEEAAKDEDEMKRRECSSFLAYKDDDGRYADFHALRHTFITNMVKSGVSPKAAQSLARHSTIDLTMNVYTSLTMHDRASALAFLPPIPGLNGKDSGVAALQATGTDGPKKVPTVVPRGAEIGAILPASPVLQIAPDCTENGDESAEGTRIGNAKNPDKNGVSRANLRQPASDCKAEREGFEPSVGFHQHRFSRPAQSATLSPLRLTMYRIIEYAPVV
jgi:integrase/recombinase XerD